MALTKYSAACNGGRELRITCNTSNGSAPQAVHKIESGEHKIPAAAEI